MVAYLGQKGSFSYQAVVTYFENETVLVGKKTFEEIFNEVMTKKANYGIVPIENTIIGKIKNVDNLLKQADIKIVDEITMNIHLHLLVKDKNQTQIKIIYGLDEVFAQCGNFMAKLVGVEKRTVSDTATAAKLVAGIDNEYVAAVASEEAAKLYGLHILHRDVHDMKNNKTRFLIITAK